MMQMDKKTVLKGMWWVKGNESDKFTGILTYGGGYVPVLEIFPKEYDRDKQKVPNNSTIYGDVFGDSRKIQAVTLLECRSENNLGNIDVGAFIYKQEFVYAGCVAIGMLLDDDEIAQVQSPQNIYLSCPGLDEYSLAHAVDYVWKDNIPKGRAYRNTDLERIVYTPPEPVAIDIDIGTITLSLGSSSENRDISSRYLIAISLENPTPQAEVNSLIYLQWLSFLSVMTGRKEFIETHSVNINSNQTRSGSLSIELNYGHIAYSTQQTKYSMTQGLLLGREENMEKFATLFPKWRENFAFVEDLAFHYLQMVDQPTETNLLQAIPHIENYVLQRLLQKNRKGLRGILIKVINSIADYFSSVDVYRRRFPSERTEHVAEQLANFRNNRIHRRNTEECTFSSAEVYAYIVVILRSIFLMEMECSYKDIDGGLGHWDLWRQIDSD
ncbi:MAG: hypothetical protein OXP68_06575 [Anaerolineaceae bacterium]|nr:hypothetical protein [Anaerolineaceae bacterium]